MPRNLRYLYHGLKHCFTLFPIAVLFTLVLFKLTHGMAPCRYAADLCNFPFIPCPPVMVLPTRLDKSNLRLKTLTKIIDEIPPPSSPSWLSRIGYHTIDPYDTVSRDPTEAVGRPPAGAPAGAATTSRAVHYGCLYSMSHKKGQGLSQTPSLSFYAKSCKP